MQRRFSACKSGSPFSTPWDQGYIMPNTFKGATEYTPCTSIKLSFRRYFLDIRVSSRLRDPPRELMFTSLKKGLPLWLIGLSRIWNTLSYSKQPDFSFRAYKLYYNLSLPAFQIFFTRPLFRGNSPFSLCHTLGHFRWSLFFVTSLKSIISPSLLIPLNHAETTRNKHDRQLRQSISEIEWDKDKEYRRLSKCISGNNENY